MAIKLVKPENKSEAKKITIPKKKELVAVKKSNDGILKAEKVSDHFMILDVISSAGTYIKEFVHSDLMRTEPSVKSLLDCDVDILQLDVRDLILLDDIQK